MVVQDRLAKLCDRLEPYLDGRLYAQDARDFEAHLESCGKCEREVAEWSRLNRNVADDWASEAERRRPSLYAARALGDRAREQRQQVASGWGPRMVGRTLAGAAMIALVVLFFTRPDSEEVSPELTAIAEVRIDAEIIALDSGAAERRRLSTGEPIIVGEGARALADLGRDRLGLGPGSRVRVIEISKRDVRVALDRGRMACDVTPRNGDGMFVVEAGPHRVIVVGTRFAARLGPGDVLEVAVSEGAVEVRTGRERVHRVEAGRQVEIGADGNARREAISARELNELSWLLERDAKPAVARALMEAREPVLIADSAEDEGVDFEPGNGIAAKTTPHPVAEEPPPPEEKISNLETWKQWIVEGKLAEAEQAIEAHLAPHPADHRAWVALGHCRRKAKNWEGAVSAYLEAARVGPPSSANQQRFRAGALLQDTLDSNAHAAEVFEEYLRHPGARSLRLDVEIRLARAYLATNRKGAAKKILERIVGQHPGAGEAVTAGKMLDDLGE